MSAKYVGTTGLERVATITFCDLVAVCDFVLVTRRRQVDAISDRGSSIPDPRSPITHQRSGITIVSAARKNRANSVNVGYTLHILFSQFLAHHFSGVRSVRP